LVLDEITFNRTMRMKRMSLRKLLRETCIRVIMQWREAIKH